ncbi:MAG: hypothetical protein KBC00_00010 [Candidatus Levybacteria bacterium]|nr:hypothetical protein [Candidatus Levybacteria bacterium]MBP9815240.1 hypothetical protein [Candidatus Levybacteria bacterium]
MRRTARCCVKRYTLSSSNPPPDRTFTSDLPTKTHACCALSDNSDVVLASSEAWMGID